jgi:photosystem II stability/assembly factor-like uncharacterized protein
MSRLTYLLAFILLWSCTADDQSGYRVPGAFHGLQLLNKGRAYPNPDIPQDGYGKAFDYHKAEFLDKVSLRDDREWEAMGPLNTTGRTLTMAFNPQNPNTIYAGSASGGLWRSYEEGEGLSWQKVETGLPTLGVSTIAFAPADSMTMYIGTGEVYNINRTGDDGAYRSTRGSYGFGILKSTDGGETWTKSLDWTYNNQEGVWMIDVSQSNPNIITAATTDGIYRSMDAGDNWSQIFNIEMATDLAVDPDNPNRIIAAFGNLGSEQRGIYRSLDGGSTWTQSEGIPLVFQGKIQIDMFKQNANILYASVGNGFWFDDGATWLCKSEDFGATWSTLNITDYSRWQGWFAHDIAIHPTNSDIVTPIGIDIWNSTDGGLTVEQRTSGGVTLGTPQAGIPDGGSNYSHSDHHFVIYHPTDPNIIYFANDGGIFKSEDGGFSYASMNGGMQTTQFYHGFVVSPLDENVALGGLQDNSTAIFRGDGNWSRAIGGDGSWAAVDPDDAAIMYGSSQNLNARKSVNSGSNWSTLPIPDNFDDPLFIAPYAVAPSNGNVLYAAGENIYKSENAGNVFDELYNGFAEGTDPIFTIEIAPSDENVAYFGTSPEGSQATVISTIDGGLTFQTNATTLPLRIVNDFSVDANDPSIVYAVLSGFGSDHVFKSTDFGINWESIDGNLPDVPTNCIQVDPNDSDHLYVGNDIAVYFSEDGGTTWDVIETGVPSAMIAMDFAISPRDHKLWIATHGNGTYRTDLLSTPILSTTDVNDPLEVNVYPNPAESTITIDFDNSQDIVATIYDLRGRTMLTETLGYQRTLNVETVESGEYIIQIAVDNDVVAIAKMLKL